MSIMIHQLCLFVCLVVLCYESEAADSCSKPTIANGQVIHKTSSSELFYGSVDCDDGFHLVGHTKYIKCQNGHWSPADFPLCTAIGSCSELPSLINGRNIPIRGSRRSAYKFKCNKGYKRFGEGRTGCDGNRWSHRSSPVCTAVGCDETGMLDFPYGEGRSMMGGAVYKYRCNPGVEMEGSNTVYCDGDQWNGTVPDCLVSPSSPTLNLIVSGLSVSSVRPGDWVLATCQANKGNPVPEIGLTIDSLPIPGISKDFRNFKNSFTFTVTPEDHGKTIECTAHNKAGTGHTSTVINVDVPPKNVELIGPDYITKGKQGHYECKYEGGYPTPILSWNINSKYMGSEPNLVVTPTSEDKELDISCHIENAYGKIGQTKSVHVKYLPESVVVTGLHKGMEGELLGLTCTSSPSYPTPNLRWRLALEGKLMEVRDEQADVITKINENGEQITTTEININLKSGVESINVICEASSDELSGLVRSSNHHIKVNKPMTLPVIKGLGVGSSLEEGAEFNLTCSTSYSSTIESIIWLLDGKVVKFETMDMIENEDIIKSSWRFIPSIENNEIECKVVGEKTLSVHAGIRVVQNSKNDIINGKYVKDKTNDFDYEKNMKVYHIHENNFEEQDDFEKIISEKIRNYTAVTEQETETFKDKNKGIKVNLETASDSMKKADKTDKLEDMTDIIWIPHILQTNENTKENVVSDNENIDKTFTVESSINNLSEEDFERPDDVLDTSALKQKKTSGFSVSIAEKQLNVEDLYSSKTPRLLENQLLILSFLIAFFLSLL